MCVCVYSAERRARIQPSRREQKVRSIRGEEHVCVPCLHMLRMCPPVGIAPTAVTQRDELSANMSQTSPSSQSLCRFLDNGRKTEKEKRCDVYCDQNLDVFSCVLGIFSLSYLSTHLLKRNLESKDLGLLVQVNINASGSLRRATGVQSAKQETSYCH